MKTVNEVSRMSGVSVRTLHHYDAIGLLKPTALTEAGYRLYDDAALARLQSILLFRELQFPLKEIKAILESPGFDRERALAQQIDLLELQRARLGQMIAFARDLLRTGGNKMDFSAFDRTELEQYAEEARAKWGETAAYAAHEKKAAGQTDAQKQADGEALMGVFAELGAVKDRAPDGEEAQALVEKLRRCITERYYPCTVQILGSLGQMYAGDERFAARIDRAGGAGTAQFTARAIEHYCAHAAD